MRLALWLQEAAERRHRKYGEGRAGKDSQGGGDPEAGVEGRAGRGFDSTTRWLRLGITYEEC